MLNHTTKQNLDYLYLWIFPTATKQHTYIQVTLLQEKKEQTQPQCLRAHPPYYCEESKLKRPLMRFEGLRDIL